MLRGQPLKILWGGPIHQEERFSKQPGTIVGLRDNSIWVACGQDTVFGIERLQRPGRKALEAQVFANGERLEEGEILG